MRFLAAIPVWFRFAAAALCCFALREAALAALADPPPLATLLSLQTIGWLGASAALWMLAPASRPRPRHFADRAAWISALLSPALAFAGLHLLELSLNTGGKESFLVPFAALHPFLTIALAILLKRERPPLAALLLFGLTLIALLLATLNPDLLRGGIRPKTWMLSRPWLHLAVLATVLLSLPPLFTLRALRSIPPSTLTHIHAWVAGATLALSLAFVRFDWNIGRLAWTLAIASGVLAAAGLWTACFALVSSSGPILSRTTALTTLAPALALLLGELTQTRSLRTEQWIAVATGLIAAGGFAVESLHTSAREPSAAR